MTDTLSQQPHMLVEKTVEPDIQRRIDYFDSQIHENPQLFGALLASLGTQAVEHTIEYGKKRTPTLKREPEELIQEYIGERYDLEVHFDNDTEQALKQDDEYHQLQQRVANRRDQMRTRRKGEIDVEGPKLRDRLRIRTLEFYIGRVATWNEQHTEPVGPPSHLRSVG